MGGRNSKVDISKNAKKGETKSPQVDATEGSSNVKTVNMTVKTEEKKAPTVPVATGSPSTATAAASPSEKTAADTEAPLTASVVPAAAALAAVETAPVSKTQVEPAEAAAAVGVSIVPAEAPATETPAPDTEIVETPAIPVDPLAITVNTPAPAELPATSVGTVSESAEGPVAPAQAVPAAPVETPVEIIVAAPVEEAESVPVDAAPKSAEVPSAAPTETPAPTPGENPVEPVTQAPVDTSVKQSETSLTEETPAAPVETPATPVEAPATIAESPAETADNPAVPAEVPAVPAEVPAVPAEVPAAPAETPAAPVESPAEGAAETTVVTPTSVESPVTPDEDQALKTVDAVATAASAGTISESPVATELPALTIESLDAHVEALETPPDSKIEELSFPEPCVMVEVSSEKANDASSESTKCGLEKTETEILTDAKIITEIDLALLPPTPADSTPTSNSAAESPLLDEQPDETNRNEQSRIVSVDA